ncbi:MAG TPA: hypothetical protein VF466_05265 [Candidatus Saccharimonadales bacterium]
MPRTPSTAPKKSIAAKAKSAAKTKAAPKKALTERQKRLVAGPVDEMISDHRSEQRPIPGSFRLMWKAMTVIKENWPILLGLALIYVALDLVLVQGLNSTSNLNSIKSALDVSPGKGLGRIGDGISLYTYLIGASGTSVAPTAGAYQFVLALVMSLATVWALRQIYAGRDIRLRDPFYYGMFPLVTFVLVLLMVVLHLLPFALGSALYGMITGNGLATTWMEQFTFLFVFLALAAVSLYMLCSSLMALYIVTLPEVSPMAALRSARDLVSHRRWTLMRKIIFLPAALLVMAGVILVPVVLFVTPAAPWIFTVVAALVLVLTHSYMYALYRSLL